MSNTVIETAMRAWGDVQTEIAKAKAELETIHREIETAKVYRAQLEELRQRYDRGSAAMAELDANITKKSEQYEQLRIAVDGLLKKLSAA